MITATAPAPRATEPAWMELVRRKVEGLRFGQVYILVHDRKVTQIECTEKTRVGGDAAPGSAEDDL